MTDVARIAAGLSEGEKQRLLAGRYDWRENMWQDHCGDIDCEMCSGLIPDGRPNSLSPADKAVRSHLQGEG